VRCDPKNEAWGFWDRWTDGRWEPETREVIERHCNGGTFVDIGAWIGPTALWAAPHTSRVVCIEADPTAFDMLGDNVAEHSHVETYRIAVAAYDGTTTITTEGDSESRTGHGGVQVPCLTIETLFSELNIDSADLIKMDIEGAEREVLPQAEPFLRAFGAPLLVSVHPWAAGALNDLQHWSRTTLAQDLVLAVAS